MKHIHILGICGTFMGGIAILARELGFKVTGSDANVYPPMSTQLEESGIGLIEGYDPSQLDPVPDLVVIGNAMSRGNPCVEHVLDRNIPYTSGPQWLLENLLKDRWVIALSGTHGKTTTASMVAWILDQTGQAPGFLIGGVPQCLGVSARLGDAPFFVVEADEYDSAFFDKRSKFVHYRPRTLVVNNLEYDHADIFPDLAAIQRQFHHLLRMVPSNGLVVTPQNDKVIDEVLEMGCWSEQQQLGPKADWSFNLLTSDGSSFEVLFEGQSQGIVNWSEIGKHNVHNGLMAIAAARHIGVKPQAAIAALATFVNAKRRLEYKGQVNNISVYDDFAHHPTAIHTTLEGLRARVGQERIFAILEPRSNTMKQGVHQNTLFNSMSEADAIFMYQPDDIHWDMRAMVNGTSPATVIENNLDILIEQIIAKSQPGDHLLVMSNGGFGGIHQKLLDGLAVTEETA
ncbi:UDP-N-acetylmuramate:L-alanyl-gamma-D-glutamyl-meso-diaminopimelate ligase [Psychrobium sp. 1_MG-2023]|uniref:UDP-N-acetylmuramate:L-alanyl-gamma-D-glutamyl- meso-diaminopimelate ligase n=1 Tax=Psychrobium sp. 1_MG-2023 TaxID=3062624 RepID=UPI000C320651|nr:UDP-N-acetylmuramate:L-alanyl-gamma-D-glutamyl-meso-diaminopimelate ligase [Psychrobium sp. 1_MG-2023]MDP2561475.1 UDP-N-acetylmuramate:L-alanyl-gamma-D-glutamyl-meso-diaminopimelate ligase [Psychrobium sp. 1_MG-2023]PKF57742.1 UDP-N-acetylmuramate:L-alanyl-gamma-D-glutamyl-meso-diaminopimelate ligase [Alteromonadales bacterium alter-6D02]